jgi:hypothetical protein
MDTGAKPALKSAARVPLIQMLIAMSGTIKGAAMPHRHSHFNRDRTSAQPTVMHG